ncbi:hypothetical protein AAG906_017132 [Vitis piasezkii]
MASYSASLLETGNPNRMACSRCSPVGDCSRSPTRITMTRRLHQPAKSTTRCRPFCSVHGMLGSGDLTFARMSAESLWGHLFIWPWRFELGWLQGSHLVPKQPSLYRCQSDPIFALVPATQLLPLLLPSWYHRANGEFGMMNPRGSRRAMQGSLPTRVTGGRAACPYKVGELEGSECASSDMVRSWEVTCHHSCPFTLQVAERGSW